MPRFTTKKKPLKKMIKNTVKAELSKQIEKKETVQHVAYTEVDNNAIYSVSGATTAFFHDAMANLVVGTGSVDNYIGEHVYLKEVNLRFHARSSANGILTGADEYNNFRVIVFQWHPDSGIDNPSTDEILDLVGVAAGSEWNALLNQTYAHKYKILADKSFVLWNTPVYNGSTIVWEEGPFATKFFKFKFTKGFNRKINFTASNNAKSKENGIFIFALSDSTVTPWPTLALETECLYTDA